jgi:hypothetical protein
LAAAIVAYNNTVISSAVTNKHPVTLQDWKKWFPRVKVSEELLHNGITMAALGNDVLQMFKKPLVSPSDFPTLGLIRTNQLAMLSK